MPDDRRDVKPSPYDLERIILEAAAQVLEVLQKRKRNDISFKIAFLRNGEVIRKVGVVGFEDPAIKRDGNDGC